jgi:hypothetical protein
MAAHRYLTAISVLWAVVASIASATCSVQQPGICLLSGEAVWHHLLSTAEPACEHGMLTYTAANSRIVGKACCLPQPNTLNIRSVLQAGATLIDML